MDANKLDKLREIEYRLGPTCGNCVNGKFTGDRSWGICLLHQYDHAKHTGKLRSLSVRVNGSCVDFESLPMIDAAGWEEFMCNDIEHNKR